MSRRMIVNPSESDFNPQVKVSAEAYVHMLAIGSTQARLRVSIFGFAEVLLKGNVFTFSRIVLPEQVATFRKSVMTPGGLVGLVKVFDECRWRGLDSRDLSGVLIMSPKKKKHLWDPELDESDPSRIGSKRFRLVVVCNQKGELSAKLERFDPRETYLNIPVEILKEPKFTAPLQMHLDACQKICKARRSLKGGD